ncbi:ferredoxin [Alcaligenaceae bacterium]|nr:ferredoxin [Alcaligenaceae bacterium]
MYAIITSKPGQYSALVDESATIIESYEYLFYGRLKAIYQLIKMEREGRVRITEDDPPYISNSVPTKFLEKFDTLEQARAELHHLVEFGNLEADLRLCEQPAAEQ